LATPMKSRARDEVGVNNPSLAIDNSSRYSGSALGEVAEWLKAALC
jgi:hypothetical protein